MAETLAARGPPKSFAQHLLEIEREAARAATRVRGANARASLSFAEPPFSSSGGRAPTPRREGRPASSSSSSSVGEERLARAEATRRRAVCETLVLRRTLPDLEMELEGCMALLRLSVNEKGHMNERAEQLHTALLAAQEVEARLVAEVQQLKTANVNLMQRLARVELGASTPASQTPLVGATTASPVSRAACINSAAACVPAPQVSQQQNSSALPSAPPTITRAATTQLSATGCATSATCDSTSGASVASTALPAAAPPTHAPSVRALPEQEDILRAAVTLALLEAKLKPGSVAASRPEDAALAAAVAAAGQMAASPPVDNAKRATWVAYASSVQSSAANSAAVVDALRRAPRWVEVTVTGAEALVGVDLTQLEQLLRSVVNDGTNAAVRDLQARAAVDGSAGVSELAASDAASRVLSSLRAASTAIQDQLRENLMASLKQQGGVDGCPEVLLRRLCARSVAAQCEDLGELVTHDELKAQILETVRGVGSVARALRMLGPQHWLESIVLGDTPEPVVEEPTVDFITTQVSRHLDPYLDGMRTAHDGATSSPPFLSTLHSTYTAAHAGRTLPAPTELVLALYLRHAIAKANSIHCFGELIMGEGRPPVSQPELDVHLAALATALQDAVRRDFSGGAAKIGGLLVDAPLLEELARSHAYKLFDHAQRMSDRLAEANAAGEEGRREEVMRIFGIEV